MGFHPQNQGKRGAWSPQAVRLCHSGEQTNAVLGQDHGQGPQVQGLAQATEEPTAQVTQLKCSPQAERGAGSTPSETPAMQKAVHTWVYVYMHVCVHVCTQVWVQALAHPGPALWKVLPKTAMVPQSPHPCLSSPPNSYPSSPHSCSHRASRAWYGPTGSSRTRHSWLQPPAGTQTLPLMTSGCPGRAGAGSAGVRHCIPIPGWNVEGLGPQKTARGLAPETRGAVWLNSGFCPTSIGLLTLA